MFKINENKQQLIDISLIDMDPMNERIFGSIDITALNVEIEEEGFHGAIEVWKKGDGRYLISSGHTRYLVAKKQGATEIPCLVSALPADNSDIVSKLIMSNIHQKKISPMAWARSLTIYDDQVLKSEKKAQKWKGPRREELAKRFGLSSSCVQRYMSLLNLIPEYTSALEEYGAPFSNYIPLTSCDPEQQKRLYPELCKIAIDGNIGSIPAKQIELIIKADNAHMEEIQHKKQYEYDIKHMLEQEYSESGQNQHVLANFDISYDMNTKDENPNDFGAVGEMGSGWDETSEEYTSIIGNYVEETSRPANVIDADLFHIASSLATCTATTYTLRDREYVKQQLQIIKDVIAKIESEYHL